MISGLVSTRALCRICALRSEAKLVPARAGEVGGGRRRHRDATRSPPSHLYLRCFLGRAGSYSLTRSLSRRVVCRTPLRLPRCALDVSLTPPVSTSLFPLASTPVYPKRVHISMKRRPALTLVDSPFASFARDRVPERVGLPRSMAFATPDTQASPAQTPRKQQVVA